VLVAGTGKTTLAKATANEASAQFRMLAPSQCLSKYQGDQMG
jgi:ATP-dependent 26S proteasome regulatory subunit